MSDCSDLINGARGRPLLSIKEATVLAEISERKVRKDIETGVLSAPVVWHASGSRLFLHLTSVFLLAAVYRSTSLSGALRKLAFSKFEEHENTWRKVIFYEIKGDTPSRMATKLHDANLNWLAACTDEIQLDSSLFLNLSHEINAIKPRLDLYISGMNRIEEREEILGGSPVFKDTRLSVMHVGKLFDSGESMEAILDDYSYITPDDVEFAKLYYRAHPPTGRPRSIEETLP
jgi:uncharacterized protein (DUF433 family)